MDKLEGRIIFAADAEGQILYSAEPIGFFGHVDLHTGQILERKHPLYGQTIKDKILVFPRAKGSTVGSYTIYGLKKNGAGPAGMILSRCETIIAVGAIIAEIACVDRVDITRLAQGGYARISGGKITFETTNIH
ncbi:DUF126 domain-containing protein [candidate division KSB1 bacterium]|nr:DUF126 domain-containing protein [candidate division KSB1 bacterium]